MKTRLFLLTCMLSAVVFAADVTGKWTGETKGRRGQTREVTMTLKADGDKLTGTIGGQQGETEISDGTVSGDTVSFTVVREFNGNSMKLHYTGKVSGDEINFKMQREGADGPGQEFTAKRSTT